MLAALSDIVTGQKTVMVSDIYVCRMATLKVKRVFLSRHQKNRGWSQSEPNNV